MGDGYSLGTVVLNGSNTATGMTVSSGGAAGRHWHFIIAVADRRHHRRHAGAGLPGTAGGVLSIAGTLSFASGATYLDTISGGSASLAAIGGAPGTATLGGATVALSPWQRAADRQCLTPF